MNRKCNPEYSIKARKGKKMGITVLLDCPGGLDIYQGTK